MRTARDNTSRNGIFAIAALVLPFAAHAQTATMPAPAAPVLPPNLTSAPSDCTVAIPPDVHPGNGAKAVVLLKVDVDATGVMHRPRIVQSSGNPNFDKAVLACADGKQNAVSRIHGEPTVVTAVVGYFVYPAGSSLIFSLANGAMPLCPSRYPPLDIRLGHQGDVSFSYRIATDGVVKDITQLTSSGYATLDQVSRDCLASWRFFPFTKDGQPVEVERTQVTHWRLMP